MATAKSSIQRQLPDSIIDKGLDESLPIGAQKGYFLLTESERALLNLALARYRAGQSEPILVGGQKILKPALLLAVNYRLVIEEVKGSQAIYGSLSETYRRCGNPDCRCHHGGPKHGPNLYISYRGKIGKTTGYYIPQYAEAQIRQGVQAWSQLQDRLRELAHLNKERLIPAKAKK